MSFTTATLTIESFYTDLKLTGDGWRPGEPCERINVTGDGDGWADDHVAYLRRTADAELARAGYERVTDWQHRSHDVHTATIRPTA